MSGMHITIHLGRLTFPKESEMGILSWLFQRAKATNAGAGSGPTQARPPEAQVRRDKHFLTVEWLDFYGLYQLSKSKGWAIGWRDSDPSAGRGGHRESGLGAYVLADLSSGKVSCHGSMSRPNNGNVSDTGAFCLEDWHFGSSLSGTFSVFVVGVQRRRFCAMLR